MEKDKKEPGSPQLELHRKDLILNTTTLPPFDIQAPKPTGFYTMILKKKS